MKAWSRLLADGAVRAILRWAVIARSPNRTAPDRYGTGIALSARQSQTQGYFSRAPYARISRMEDLLLHPDEPPPFSQWHLEGKSNFLIVADHASNRIPRRL